MSEEIKEEVKAMLADFPAFLSTADLLSLGIYRTRPSLVRARLIGTSPPEVYFSQRNIKFPRNELIKWLSDKLEKKNRRSARRSVGPYSKKIK
jgi:hypothetical protein